MSQQQNLQTKIEGINTTANAETTNNETLKNNRI